MTMKISVQLMLLFVVALPRSIVIHSQFTVDGLFYNETIAGESVCLNGGDYKTSGAPYGYSAGEKTHNFLFL